MYHEIQFPKDRVLCLGCGFQAWTPNDAPFNDIEEHHERWPRWIPAKEYRDAFASISELPSFIKGQMIDSLGKIYIPAIWDSPPLFKEKPYPLIVFSHGLTACRTTYSANHVELASQGYIVAAIEHRDGSACYTYYLKNSKPSDNSSKSTEKEDEHGNAMQEKEPIPLISKSISSEFFSLRNIQVHQRAEECIATLDLLKDINDGNAPKNVMDTNCKLGKFKRLFDLDSVALMGHSFGGGTALLALSKDPRFRVGVVFDPWMMPIHKEEDLPTNLTQPMLIVSSNGFFDQKAIKVLRKFQERKIETKCFTIRNTTHISQCDVPFIVPNNVLTRMVSWGLQHDYKDKYIHLDIHNKMIMLFLAEHLDISVDAEFQAFIDDNSFHIIEGIDFLPPVKRKRWVYFTVSLITVLCTTVVWYFVW